MTTTANQDPGDRFTFFIEEVRRIGEVQGRRPGIAGRMHLLICELFIFILRLLARHAGQVRNGAIGDGVVAGGKERRIGWQRRWEPEAPVSGGEAWSPLQRAEIVEVSVAAPRAVAAAVVLNDVVEVAAALRLPRWLVGE